MCTSSSLNPPVGFLRSSPCDVTPHLRRSTTSQQEVMSACGACGGRGNFFFQFFSQGRRILGAPGKRPVLNTCEDAEGKAQRPAPQARGESESEHNSVDEGGTTSHGCDDAHEAKLRRLTFFWLVVLPCPKTEGWTKAVPCGPWRGKRAWASCALPALPGD